MGRTLASATQLVEGEREGLGKFRRALRADDQAAFDDLFRGARVHVAEIGFAAHLLPFECVLLAMLIEEHKRVLKLESILGRPVEPDTNETERLDFRRLPLPGGDEPVAD